MLARRTRRLDTWEPRRVAAWGLAALVALLAATGGLALSAERRLAIARERLLAGDDGAAQRELSGIRWPEARARRAAGMALVQVLRGAHASPAPGSALACFEPEALLVSTLGRGTLLPAERLASFLARSGEPVAVLYEAALRMERGDELGARALVAASPFPLAARGLGRRLERVLALRGAGAYGLALDRNGEPVATLAGDGTLSATAEEAPYVAQALGRANLLRAAATPAARAVRLTVDLELSRAALAALGQRRGSIVLVEPVTGAVLAAVTDAETASREPAAAFEQQREPASIAKLLTAAAAYRARHDADALIGGMSCTGVERYGGQPLWCPWPTGRLAGLDHALAVSCNVAFANLGMLVGRERLTDEYVRWGFDAPQAAMLAAAGRIVTRPELPRQLADLAIGLTNADITPLHAALLAAVTANRGRMAEPHLVTGGSGLLGLGDAPLPRPPAREVVPAGVAARLVRAMRVVVEYGTAFGLEPHGLETAMKTGTASLPRLGYHVNYIGFAPAAAPSVAFCVRITGRRSSHAVRADAREVTKRLLDALAARRLPLESAARAQRARARLVPGEAP